LLAGAPLLLQPFRFFDIGTAGLAGFKSKVVRDLRFVRGDHDASIAEDMWQNLARIVFEEDLSQLDLRLFEGRRSFFEWLRCKAQAPLVALGAIFVILIGLALVTALIQPSLLFQGYQFL
jgi:hypothetical protein